MDMLLEGSNPSAEENGAISGPFYDRENCC